MLKTIFAAKKVANFIHTSCKPITVSLASLAGSSSERKLRQGWLLFHVLSRPLLQMVDIPELVAWRIGATSGCGRFVCTSPQRVDNAEHCAHNCHCRYGGCVLAPQEQKSSLDEPCSGSGSRFSFMGSIKPRFNRFAKPHHPKEKFLVIVARHIDSWHSIRLDNSHLFLDTLTASCSSFVSKNRTNKRYVDCGSLEFSLRREHSSLILHDEL